MKLNYNLTWITTLLLLTSFPLLPLLFLPPQPPLPLGKCVRVHIRGRGKKKLSSILLSPLPFFLKHAQWKSHLPPHKCSLPLSHSLSPSSSLSILSLSFTLWLARKSAHKMSPPLVAHISLFLLSPPSFYFHAMEKILIAHEVLMHRIFRSLPSPYPLLPHLSLSCLLASHSLYLIRHHERRREKRGERVKYLLFF